MTSPSLSPIPHVRDQLAGEPVPGDLVAQERPVPAGVVPVRRTLVTAGISMAAFIALSITPYANEALTVQSDPKMMLLVSELFWLSAAAMGASFAMLLGHRDERSYWVRFVVGVMAGFILVALLPVSGLAGIAELPRPTIAFLGAFLASMAFRFLPGAHTRPGHERDHATTEP